MGSLDHVFSLGIPRATAGPPGQCRPDPRVGGAGHPQPADSRKAHPTGGDPIQAVPSPTSDQRGSGKYLCSMDQNRGWVNGCAGHLEREPGSTGSRDGGVEFPA